ncbi:MAG: hypothetical protein H7201_20055 [Candidatus Saccharibacteria bacterium]|nr:hypothetical protein [Microbacteriaceae bacterium]
MPLQLRFWAAYLMTTATLGIGWYETEWVMLRKLRRVMVNLEAFPADRGGVPLAKLAEDNTRNFFDVSPLRDYYPSWATPAERTRELSHAHNETKDPFRKRWVTPPHTYLPLPVFVHFMQVRVRQMSRDREQLWLWVLRNEASLQGKCDRSHIDRTHRTITPTKESQR